MAAPGRSMGLDVGDVRIGVAISDPMGIISQPHDVVTCVSPEKDAAAIASMADAIEVKRIVVGLPLDQNGQPGAQAEKIMTFIDVLKRHTSAEIFTQDERFTTAFAERALIGANIRRKNRKGMRDKVAAQQILQTWLDRDARRRNAPQ